MQLYINNIAYYGDGEFQKSGTSRFSTNYEINTKYIIRRNYYDTKKYTFYRGRGGEEEIKKKKCTIHYFGYPVYAVERRWWLSARLPPLPAAPPTLDRPAVGRSRDGRQTRGRPGSAHGHRRPGPARGRVAPSDRAVRPRRPPFRVIIIEIRGEGAGGGWGNVEKKNPSGLYRLAYRHSCPSVRGRGTPCTAADYNITLTAAAVHRRATAAAAAA